MLDQLTAAVDGLDLSVDVDELVAAFALHDRLTARLTAVVAEVDAAELWDLDGSVSMAAMLRNRCGMTDRDAKRITATGRRLRICPVTAAAWTDGRLSGGQVAAVVANVTDDTAELFAEHEPEVVARLEPLDLRGTTVVMQRWAILAKAALDLDGSPPDDPKRNLHLSRVLDGRGRIDGDLFAEGHEVVGKALQLAESPDADGEERTPGERRADALVDVCRHFLDHQQRRTGGRHRPHVNVVVDAAALAAGQPGRTLEGLPLDGATLRKLACDAALHRVITDGRSSILDYGHATRTIPPAVYTSLVLRDLGCRFPGCGRKPEWCEGHHIHHWEDGGPTCLSNLVLLCSRHHHRCHLKGWQIKLLPSGVVEVTAPDGRTWSGDPPLLC
jgi:hypothetical protein